ncbi:MAG TPA: GFA family protein [Stellaceae bacterium]|nr:GFA family protein [Stellaceae bacterium]
MKITGGCHCGHIKYEAEVDPATVRVCHCNDCQKLTGTAFRTNIASLPDTFRLTSGTPKTYLKTAESGNKRAHGFCPECGTPIYATSPEPNPPSYGLRVGGIDQRKQFASPNVQIWCESAMPWSMDITEVNRVERQ